MSLEPDQVRALLIRRRSIRRFTPEPVSRKVVEDLLTLACRAPSAHNRQPWRFAVLQKDETKTRLARAMGEALRSDRLADGDDPLDVEADVRRSNARITGAPVVVVLCLTLADMDRYPDQRRARAERLMAVQSVAMAGQNLMLAAHGLGLGSCWMCAPLFAPEQVHRALQLPAEWEPQGMVVLGYPDGPARRRGRKKVAEVTVWL